MENIQGTLQRSVEHRWKGQPHDMVLYYREREREAKNIGTEVECGGK